MNYQDLASHCTELLRHRMSETTANILFEELFPSELSELWETHLELSDELIRYAEKALNI